MEKIGLTLSDLVFLLEFLKTHLESETQVKKTLVDVLNDDTLTEAERSHKKELYQSCYENWRKLNRLVNLFEDAELL